MIWKKTLKTVRNVIFRNILSYYADIYNKPVATHLLSRESWSVVGMLVTLWVFVLRRLARAAERIVVTVTTGPWSLLVPPWSGPPPSSHLVCELIFDSSQLRSNQSLQCNLLKWTVSSESSYYSCFLYRVILTMCSTFLFKFQLLYNPTHHVYVKLPNVNDCIV